MSGNKKLYVQLFYFLVIALQIMVIMYYGMHVALC